MHDTGRQPGRYLMKKDKHKAHGETRKQSRPSWNRKKENFYLWMFITQEGLFEEASNFIFENKYGKTIYALKP